MITSDDFQGDPYGWLTNQCGHGVLGMVIAVYGDFFGIPWLFCPAIAALVYFAAVEVWGQRLTLWRDAIMDTANVMAGATMPAAMARDDATAPAVLTVWGMILIFGYVRRL